MRRNSVNIAVIAVLTMMVLGGLLTSTANSTSSDTGRAATVWTPKSTDWAQFRQDAARTGVTSANATMRFAYYKWSARSGYGFSASVADLRTTGIGTDVVVGANDQRIYCLNGADGSVRWRYQTGGNCYCPAIADINADGRPEVVAGSSDGRIYALNGNNGTLLWRYTTRGMINTHPALADINGDGIPDVVAASSDGNLFALNGRGERLWAVALGPNMFTPAIGDINGDGKAEVVVNSEYGITLHALEGKTGVEIWNLTTTKARQIQTGPVIGDSDGDGSIEVVVPMADGHIYSLAGQDGKAKWSANYLGTTLYWNVCPIIGDGDGDGHPEVYISPPGSQMLCLNGANGNLKWGRDFQSYIYSSPALADIDGDGKLELIIGTNNNAVWALNAEDGSTSWVYALPSNATGSPAVADIDRDRKAEVVIGANNLKVYALDYNF